MQRLRLCLFASLLALAACRSEPPAAPVGQSMAVADCPKCPACAEELARPSWQEHACKYPQDWVGPAQGGVALFLVATPEEIRAAHPGLLPASDPGAKQLSESPDPTDYSKPVRLDVSGMSEEGRLARIDIDGIEGLELSVLPGDGAIVETELPAHLVGPLYRTIYEVPPAITTRLAGEKDHVAFGKRWAAALLEHSKVPPKLTPEQEEQMRQEIKKRFGRELAPEEMKWTPPDPDGFREAGWVAVACELTQLARFAEKSGKRIYLELYAD
jgi:hypothetical protein